MGGGGEFGGIDIASLGGGEAKGGPIGRGAGVFEALVKMIAALGRADQKGAALAIGEGGADNFEPDFGAERGVLIEDDEIETVATERGWVVGATDSDGGAGESLDAELGFGGSAAQKGWVTVLRRSPDDAFGLAVTGSEIPDVAARGLGGAEDFSESETGFAETAAGGEDAETGRRVEDLELMSAQAEDLFVVLNTLHGALHRCLGSQIGHGRIRGGLGWAVSSSGRGTALFSGPAARRARPEGGGGPRIALEGEFSRVW